ncbi:MAG: hypothetical protein ACM3ST_03980 [Bdellovibrio bacteriovorus]
MEGFPTGHPAAQGGPAEIKAVARKDPITAAEGAILEGQLDRLWKAVEEEGVDFRSEVADRWGEVCPAPSASRTADDFLPTCV